MTLAAQLNRTATDLPGALVTQWLAWIRLFNFEVRHVPGARNTVADALSRRPPIEQDVEEMEREEDIDEWVERQLGAVRICPIRAGRQIHPGGGFDESPDLEGPPSAMVFHEDEYSDESQRIAEYLLSGGRRPRSVSTSEFGKFKKNALHFFVRRGHLFRRPDRRNPTRRVVDADERRLGILKALHDDGGHRGIEGTYRRVADRYWWDGMWRDV